MLLSSLNFVVVSMGKRKILLPYLWAPNSTYTNCCCESPCPNTNFCSLCYVTGTQPTIGWLQTEFDLSVIVNSLALLQHTLVPFQEVFLGCLSLQIFFINVNRTDICGAYMVMLSSLVIVQIFFFISTDLLLQKNQKTGFLVCREVEE